MTHDELLAEINRLDNILTDSYGMSALFAVVKLHKPYDSEDTPHEFAMGWCKGCSIEYNRNEYASQPYPCPTIQAIEKELK
jgi:hypothetical protein